LSIHSKIWKKGKLRIKRKRECRQVYTALPALLAALIQKLSKKISIVISRAEFPARKVVTAATNINGQMKLTLVNEIFAFTVAKREVLLVLQKVEFRIALFAHKLPQC
jgi:hypothetical protein